MVYSLEDPIQLEIILKDAEKITEDLNMTVLASYYLLPARL